MTICERINERNEVMSIDFLPDLKVTVVKSYGFSIMYCLKYQEIQKYLEHNKIILDNSLCNQASVQTMQWIKAYDINFKEDKELKQ